MNEFEGFEKSVEEETPVDDVFADELEPLPPQPMMIDHPALRKLAAYEAEREVRMEEVRAAFIKAYKRK